MTISAHPEYLMARRATLRLSRTAFWFALGLSLTTLLIVAFYPTVRDSSDDLEKAYRDVPAELLEAFGIETLDFSAYSSFINAEILGFIFPITAGIFVIMQGAATVAREVESGTISLWLSVPVDRWRLLLGKIVALLLGSAFIAATTAASIGIGNLLVDGDLSGGSVVSIFVVLLGYMVAVAGVAVACSSFTNDRGRAGAFAAAFVLAGYILKIVAGFSVTFDWLRYLSIFTAYKTLPALQDGTVPSATITLYLVGILAAALGLIIFQRRDIVI